MANTSFSQLKRNSKKNLETLTKEAQKLVNKPSFDDDRFWKPTINKDGNGSAVIRFLDAPEGEEVPFVKYYKHNFKNPKTNQWYIENSRTSLGNNEPDPCGEYNSKLWATGIESNKKIARDQKRKQVFVSNIYVVNDPAKPECNGKVFLYEYGAAIFGILNDAMHPVDDGSGEVPDPINPFSLFEGANLKLKIRSVESDINGSKKKLPNYEKSTFDEVGPLLPDEDDMEAVWNQCHKLQPFLDPSNFKSYEQLKARLDKVLGLNSNTAHEDPQEVETPYSKNSQRPNWKGSAGEDEDDDDIPFTVAKRVKEVEPDEDDTPGDSEDDEPSAVVDDDEDEGMSFFKKLAEKSKK
jgi:hypothetical protein